MGQIKSWSISRLFVYEECPFRAKLAWIEKLPEPPPKPDAPNVRGDRVHNHAEGYVSGKVPVQCPEMSKHFGVQFDKLKVLYEAGHVELEEMWEYDEFWKPMKGSRDTPPWLRIKLDAWVGAGQTGVVIDYKTGRKFGNEVKHTQQTHLYAIGAFFKFPELTDVVTELWYLDQNDTLRVSYTRDQALRFLGSFEARVEKMMEDTIFRPRPNVHSCKYCPYSPRGTGACPVGV
jgi:CRISPR/Cas system-associated exonuclease Cas4 (RecB family)